MTVTRFLTILTIVLLAAGTQAADNDVSYFNSKDLSRAPQAAQTNDTCRLLKHDPSQTTLGFNSAYATGWQTIVYFDPAECGADTTYPFEIQRLWFTLLDPPDGLDSRTYKWPVELDVVLYGLPDSGDTCSGPGIELCRETVVCDSTSFAWPEVGSVELSPACCVDEPFFIGIEYTDTSSEPLPSLVYDTLATDTCHVFMFVENVWYGWYAFWVTPPGYPFFWVDGQSRTDLCCPDGDGDGICEADDNCPGLANADQTDSDGDGFGDACDNCLNEPNPGQEDTDGDTVADACDNCPGVANAGQSDADFDGIGNVCDNCPDDPFNDADGDGLCAGDDNCPTVSNPLQEDADNDGQGDACETIDTCAGLRGNVNGDLTDEVNIADLTFLVDYIFRGGPPPPVPAEADVNASGDITVSDLTYLVDFIFRGGPGPSPC